MGFAGMKYARLALVVGILTAVAGIAGCPRTVDNYGCTKPDKSHVAVDGTEDPCHCLDPDAGVDVGEIKPPEYCEMFRAAGKGGASPEGP